MAPFGRARNGGISAQELTGVWPPTAHMLHLAGFAALGQQLNGASNGFSAPKSEMPVSVLSVRTLHHQGHKKWPDLLGAGLTLIAAQS